MKKSTLITKLRALDPTRFIANHSVAILIAAVLLTIPAYIGIVKTPINYDLMTYLPKDLDSVKASGIMGNAASGFLIVEGKSTREILDIKERLSAIDGVQSVAWIGDVVDPTVPKEMLPDAIQNALWAGDSTIMLVSFIETSTSPRTKQAVAEVRKKMGKGCYLAGGVAIGEDTQIISDKETPLYILLAIGFSVLVLGLSMESYLIPLIFLVQIALAVLYNMGTNYFLGTISYFTQSLAAVLQLGVTMDFSIFLLHRYDEERKKYSDKKEAMAEALRRTFVTISGGALTEIAGFLALCVMDITLGSDIGFVMAKGVVTGVIGTMTILPSILLVLDGPIHRFRHRPLLPKFEKTAAFVSKRCVTLSIIFVLLFVPAIYGKNHVRQYYNLSDVLPQSMPSIEATNKLRAEFKMMTTHTIVMNGNLPPSVIRDAIAKIEAVDGITWVLAPEKFIGGLIPNDFLPDSVLGLFKKGDKQLIMANSIYKAASVESDRQLDEIIAIAKAADPGAMVSGEGALNKDFVSIMTRDIQRVDLVSIAAVFIIILIILSSLSLPIILVGSIELAIFINMSLPFFLGETVPYIASVFIGCIQLGVTIDYAVLLVTRFKEELWKGLDRHTAMRQALQGSARSILTSGLTLFAATEGVIITSQMDLLKSICNMIGRGAIVSMFVIIFILPSLLVLSEGLVSRTSLNWKKPAGRNRSDNKESSS